MCSCFFLSSEVRFAVMEWDWKEKWGEKKNEFNEIKPRKVREATGCDWPHLGNMRNHK